MSWDQLEHMLSKFNFSFNWEYSGDHELRSLLSDVFRILEGDDKRSLEQILISCVHEACPGLTLIQPKSDLGLPYEMKFIVHPSHEDFCITKLIILSEARNLELYVNGGYEKSSRGIMLTMNKGRKLSLFEATFDLSGYVDTVSNATVKFLSFPCKNHMKIQAVVMKVEKCQPISRCNEEQPGSPVDLGSVKRFLGSVGKPLSNDAQKMLQSIENYQKSPAFKAQQMLSSRNACIQDVASCIAQPPDKEVLNPGGEGQVKEEKAENLDQTCQMEKDTVFMNMLSKICSKENLDGDKQASESGANTSPPQSRWAAYLQSRVRASRNLSPESLPGAFRSMSVEERFEKSEEHPGKTRTRQRPSSVGCVDSGEMERTFNLDRLRQKWIEAAEHSRCKTCGCPGCLSVYNSVTTNIFAAEGRILEKVDKRIAQLQGDIDKKFETMFQLLRGRSEMEDEQVFTQD